MLHIGLDVGSTTVKIAVLDDENNAVYKNYQRHYSDIKKTIAEVLGGCLETIDEKNVTVAVTGSGGISVSHWLGIPFVQEVSAGTTAIQTFIPQTDVAIELGGEDAKITYLTGGIEQRMNGSCAGGTGAFIDEMAKLMGVGTESGEFEQLASRGTTVHEVSGRCGVYAKTDIQPLLNEGIPTTDLALSALHAVARQTIGGLAQGIDIEPPVIFEGGTLAYNPTLVRVFREQLNLSDDQVIVRRDPQIMVARGAALSLTDMFASSQPIDLPDAFVRLDKLETVAPASGEGRLAQPFFATPAEQADFTARHGKETPARRCV